MAITTQFQVSPSFFASVINTEDLPFAEFSLVNGQLIINHNYGTFTLVNGEVIFEATDDEIYSGAMANTWRDLSVKGTITPVGASPVSLTDEMICGWNTDEGDTGFPLGSAVSNRLTLSLDNTEGDWLYGGDLRGNYPLIGAKVEIELGVYHSGAYDYEKIGTFYVEKTNYMEGDTRITLNCSDALLFDLNGTFEDDQTYPRTLQQIFDYIVTEGSISLDPDFDTLACNASVSIPSLPKWGDGVNYRQALAYVCAVTGSFLRVGRNGLLQIVPAYNSTASHALDTSQYIQLTDDEMTFAFNRIKMQYTDTDSISSAVNSGLAEAASNTITIEKNPLMVKSTTYSYSKTVDTVINPNKTYYVYASGAYVAVANPVSTSLSIYYARTSSNNVTAIQSIADGLKTYLTGLSLRGTNVKWRGDPLLLVGNTITLTDRAGNTITTCVFSQSLNFEQGFSANIQCQLEDDKSLPSIYYAAGGTVDVTGENYGVVIPDDESVTLEKLAPDFLLPVANGGTGLATVTANSYLKGNGTENLVSRTPAQVLFDIAAVPLAGGTLSGAIIVVAAGYPVIRGDRSTAYTTTLVSAIDVLHSTSGDMAAEFGAGLTFSIKDVTGTVNPIALIGAVREAADNSGSIVFQPYVSGTITERMRLLSNGNLGIGGTPNANAILDVASTTKAFMPPRMTTTQRDAISTPTEGMVIYNLTTHVLDFYNGTAWGAV